MKISKSEFEALIREGVQAELGSLNEEELEELFGGLKKLAGAAAGGIAKAGAAVGGAVRDAGTAARDAVSGAAQKVGAAASGAVGAVKDTYKQGEKEGSLKKAMNAIDDAIKNGADADTLGAIKLQINQELQAARNPAKNTAKPAATRDTVQTAPAQVPVPMHTQEEGWSHERARRDSSNPKELGSSADKLPSPPDLDKESDQDSGYESRPSQVRGSSPTTGRRTMKREGKR